MTPRAVGWLASGWLGLWTGCTSVLGEQGPDAGKNDNGEVGSPGTGGESGGQTGGESSEQTGGQTGQQGSRDAGSEASAGSGGVTGSSGGTGGVAASAGRTGTGAGGSAGRVGGAGAGTASAGTAGSGATGAGGATSMDAPAGWVPALLGVGYGGIRVVSRDGGKTWGDRTYATTNGGDDNELLRAVTYGKGRWIAMGWKLVVSDDGVHWVDHGLIGDNHVVGGCNIVEGLAFKDGTFYAACTPWSSPGTVFRSSDGLTWSKLSEIGDTGGHLYLTYQGGKLVAYGDNPATFQSTDALTWTVLPGLNKGTYCKDNYMNQSDCLDSAWFNGTWLRADWQGIISRSTDGKTFSRVYLDDQKNTLYQSRAIAAGFVAP